MLHFLVLFLNINNEQFTINGSHNYNNEKMSTFYLSKLSAFRLRKLYSVNIRILDKTSEKYRKEFQYANILERDKTNHAEI